MNKHTIKNVLLIIYMLALLTGCLQKRSEQKNDPCPNILFAFADDQSWLHTGAFGDSNVKTPAFDGVVNDG